MKDYAEFTIKFAQIIQKARKLRGDFLDEVVFIEFILDLIILKYFCESAEKIEKFQATLLNSDYFPFQSKIKTFNNLSFGDKLSDVKKNLGSMLEEVRKIRNELAHRMIDSSDEAVKNCQLRFVYYKGGKRKIQEFEEDFLQKNLELLEKAKVDLLILLTEGDFSRKSAMEIGLVKPS